MSSNVRRHAGNKINEMGMSELTPVTFDVSPENKVYLARKFLNIKYENIFLFCDLNVWYFIFMRFSFR
ncbi:hypothetical protein ACW9H6_28290 [Pseudomonas sp. SDO528_S397]